MTDNMELSPWTGNAELSSYLQDFIHTVKFPEKDSLIIITAGQFVIMKDMTSDVIPEMGLAFVPFSV
jgi:hypothetical protein